MSWLVNWFGLDESFKLLFSQYIIVIGYGSELIKWVYSVKIIGLYDYICYCWVKFVSILD